MARKRLGEILVQAGVLDEARLRAALAEQRRWGGPLGRILVDMGGITEDAMVAALSHQLNFPTVNLDQVAIPSDVVDLVPPELAEQHNVVPFSVQGKFLDVAMADPTNLGIIDEMRIRTRLNVRPHLCGPKMIERAIARYYGRGQVPVRFGGDEYDAKLSVVPASAPIFEGPQTRPGRPSSPPPDAPVASAAAARRAASFDLQEQTAMVAQATAPLGQPAIAPAPAPNRDREIAALQSRVQHLEALVARDEDVLRKLMGLLIEKGLATREEILERLQS